MSTHETTLVPVTVAPLPRTGQETLFHSEPWRRAVESSFDLEIREFASTSEDGGRAFYSLISDIRGDRVVSTPFSDFCDPLLGPVGWAEFSDHLRSYGLPITIRPFRNQVAVDDSSYERRHELLWHGIDLGQGHEAIWDGLKSKLRTAIRRAPKQSIRLRWSSDLDDIARFHAMHVDLRKSKYQLLAQPLEFFVALHENFGDDMAMVIAEIDREPIATMVFFAWNGVWYHKFGASYPRTYRPNAAMVMEACREGSQRGLCLLDMGRSDIDQPGLVSFKQQFASAELALTTLHWTPDGYRNPDGAAVDRTLTAMTRLLTRPDVPADVTAEGGALLYKFFG